MENFNDAGAKLEGNQKKLLVELTRLLNFDHPAPINQSAIGKAIGIDSAKISIAVKLLKEKGFILEEGKEGRLNCYRLNADVTPPGEEPKKLATQHMSSDNQFVSATPAGTELMMAFEIIDKGLPANISGYDPAAGSVPWDDEEDDDEDDEEYEDEDDEEFDPDDIQEALEDADDASKRGLTRMIEDYDLSVIVRKNQPLSVLRRIVKRKLRELKDDEKPSGYRAKTNLGKVDFPPEIYFQFVKTKLSEPQLEQLSERTLKLTGMVKSADLMGQIGLYESLAMELTSAVREQEIAVIGLGRHLPEALVKSIIPKIKGKTKILFRPLSEFPRVIPKIIQDQILQVQEKKVFDEYHILYMDGSGQKKLETVAEKIQKKDPILFGKIHEQPDRLYFIIDWTDEFCDLTLDKMIEHIKVDDPEFKLDAVGDVDQDYVNRIVEDTKKRRLRLKQTDPRTWRRLLREEEAATREREEHAKSLKNMESGGDSAEMFVKTLIQLKGKSWMENMLSEDE
jgi:hypothetical protein